LIPVLRERATENEAAGVLSPEIHAEFLAAGFYRMTMPSPHGTTTTLPECMRTLEALAAGDGSAAWSVLAGLGGPAMSAFVDAEGCDEMQSPREAMIAGSVAGMGQACETDGGFIVSGRWSFVSNVHHATYAGCICLVVDAAGQPQGLPNGEPVMVVPFWPAGDCRIIPNWQTTGMRATGSDDISVEGLFVPSHRVADFRRAPRSGLNELHYLNVENAANLAVASVALGIARNAVEAFAEIATAKRDVHGIVLAETPLARVARGTATTQLDQARGHLYEVAELMTEELAQGTYQDDAWLGRTSLASVGAADAAVDLVCRLYRAAGTSAIRTENRLDRCLRDVFTLAAHKTVQHANLLKYGAAPA
jgi:alkylation response protein AidB-like acyl-CoA dehydrogenase